jgi:type I restriction enzyme S subunit
MEYKIFKLGDILESISKTHTFSKNELIFLNTSDILEGNFLKKKYSKINLLPGQAKKTIKKDDILFSEIRPKNKRFAYVSFEDTEDYVVSTKLMVLRLKNYLAIPRYVYYYLSFESTLNYLQTLAESRSGTFPQITFAEISSLEIPIPSIEVQNKVIDLLDSVNGKLRNNNELIKKMEILSTLIFKHWFIDFEFPNEQGQPYKSSGGKMVESELGMIPENWKVDKVKTLAIKMSSGGTPSRKNPEYWTEASIPWIKTKEINNNYLISAEEMISEAGLKNSSAKLIEKNAVLVAMYGATAGKLALLKFRASTNQACCAIETQHYMYLYNYLTSIQKTIENLSTGSAQQNLSKQLIENIKIIIPTSKVLMSFEEIAVSISNQIENLYKENCKLVQTRDILLPKLLSGEIEVPVPQAEKV